MRGHICSCTLVLEDARFAALFPSVIAGTSLAWDSPRPRTLHLRRSLSRFDVAVNVVCLCLVRGVSWPIGRFIGQLVGRLDGRSVGLCVLPPQPASQRRRSDNVINEHTVADAGRRGPRVNRVRALRIRQGTVAAAAFGRLHGPP